MPPTETLVEYAKAVAVLRRLDMLGYELIAD